MSCLQVCIKDPLHLFEPFSGGLLLCKEPQCLHDILAPGAQEEAAVTVMS